MFNRPYCLHVLLQDTPPRRDDQIIRNFWREVFHPRGAGKFVHVPIFEHVVGTTLPPKRSMVNQLPKLNMTGNEPTY